MSFLEFLSKSDMSTLSDLSVVDVILATGIAGLLVLLLLGATFATLLVGSLSRPKPILSLLLGALAFCISIAGAYHGYRIADASVMELGGWAAADPIEIASGAAFTMVLVYLGLGALVFGLLGMFTGFLLRGHPREEMAARAGSTAA